MSHKYTLSSFIWKFVKIQKWRFFFIFLLSLTWSIDSTLWPYILRKIIDVFTEYDTNREVAWPALKDYAILGGLLWIMVETCFRYRDFSKAKAFPKFEADIRMMMFDHVQHHSPKYFNEHFSGSLSNKINDLTTQSTLIIQHLMLFLPSFVTCIVSLIFFFEVNPRFTLILGGWILTHFGICFAFTKKCAYNSIAHGEVRSSLAGEIADSLTNNFTVNLFSRFKYEMQRVRASQKIEREKNFLAKQYTSWTFTWLSVVFLLGGFSLNTYMIMSWLRGAITTGETIQIFNTTWNLMFAMWFSGEMIPEFFQSLGIARQALSIMNDPQDVLDLPGAVPLVVKKGEIVFENVTFHHGGENLFMNKNVFIKGGEKVGLVGYSGAGKSTFVNLILRFFPLQKGKILIDGQDIANVTLHSLHSQISLIPQDPLLFHRTLEENIQYGRIEATKEEVIEAAKLAHCDEFIRSFPEGYATLVGERGTKISGGERQRIAIARAILKQASILILDEATSALDSQTEKLIQESIESLAKNRTTLVIAHRLSTLAKMDRILVFDKGKIVEEGSHNALLEKEGHYKHLWNMQSGGFLPQDVNHPM